MSCGIELSPDIVVSDISDKDCVNLVIVCENLVVVCEDLVVVCENLVVVCEKKTPLFSSLTLRYIYIIIMHYLSNSFIACFHSLTPCLDLLH